MFVLPGDVKTASQSARSGNKSVSDESENCNKCFYYSTRKRNSKMRRILITNNNYLILKRILISNQMNNHNPHSPCLLYIRIFILIYITIDKYYTLFSRIYVILLTYSKV